MDHPLLPWITFHIRSFSWKNLVSIHQGKLSYIESGLNIGWNLKRNSHILTSPLSLYPTTSQDNINQKISGLLHLSLKISGHKEVHISLNFAIPWTRLQGKIQRNVVKATGPSSLTNSWIWNFKNQSLICMERSV